MAPDHAALPWAALDGEDGRQGRLVARSLRKLEYAEAMAQNAARQRRRVVMRAR